MTGHVIFGPWSRRSPVRQPVPTGSWWVRLTDDHLVVRCRGQLGFIKAPVHPAPLNAPLPDRAPNRDRITMALDYGGMYGPEVDEALGVSGTDLFGRACDAGVVDGWEDGTIVPSHDDIRRLATLTGFQPHWFYLGTLPTIDERSLHICGRGGAR